MRHRQGWNGKLGKSKVRDVPDQDGSTKLFGLAHGCHEVSLGTLGDCYRSKFEAKGYKRGGFARDSKSNR